MNDYETDLSPETIPSISDDDIEALADAVNVSIRLIERIEKLELAIAKCKEENAKRMPQAADRWSCSDEQ